MLDSAIYQINNNKLIIGLAMILMNVGSKYVIQDLPRSLDNIFQNIWLRRLIIFCMAFISTHDVKTALLLTLLFILIFNILLNEKSKGCILPAKYLDFNKDGIITQDEVKRAKEILTKYQRILKYKQ